MEFSLPGASCRSLWSTSKTFALGLIGDAKLMLEKKKRCLSFVSMWPWDKCDLSRVSPGRLLGLTPARPRPWVRDKRWGQINKQTNVTGKTAAHKHKHLPETFNYNIFYLKILKPRPALWNPPQLSWWGGLFCFSFFLRFCTRSDSPATAGPGWSDSTNVSNPPSHRGRTLCSRKDTACSDGLIHRCYGIGW